MTPNSQSGSTNGSGDPAVAFAAHRRWLRTVVLARERNPDAVDEILQEVALAAVRGREALTDPARAPAWLYRVAVRQALLYRRRRGRARRRIERYAETVSRAEAEAADPIEWLLSDEQSRRMRRALAALPSRDQEILLLKYTEDWTYRELAEHLGVSEDAVQSRLHRARARLRAGLARRTAAS